jgi:hypothetical protein
MNQCKKAEKQKEGMTYGRPLSGAAQQKETRQTGKTELLTLVPRSFTLCRAKRENSPK